jgi:hypothetical protein
LGACVGAEGDDDEGTAVSGALGDSLAEDDAGALAPGASFVSRASSIAESSPVPMDRGCSGGCGGAGGYDEDDDDDDGEGDGGNDVAV